MGIRILVVEDEAPQALGQTILLTMVNDDVTMKNPTSQNAGKWRPEYSAQLKFRRVAIIPDNDEPGLKHAEAVFGSLARHLWGSGPCFWRHGRHPGSWWDRHERG